MEKDKKGGGGELRRNRWRWKREDNSRRIKERQNKGRGGKVRRNRRRWKREDNSKRNMEKDKTKEEEEK